MNRALKTSMGLLRSPAVWIPAIVLAATTTVFWATDTDLAMMRPFFASPEGPLDGRWPLTLAQPWIAIYNWGVYPALFLGCGGLIVWIVSFFWQKLEPWRDPGLFFALVLIVGPGILVNVVFKPYWSRPRPRATVPFGGERDFVPVLQRGQGEDDFSFPSGHAATGFYLMVPAFVCYRRRPWLAAGFLLLGLAGGGIVGLARMVAGCHFPSDVLWSGGLVYFTALLLATPFRFGAKTGQEGCPAHAFSP